MNPQAPRQSIGDVAIIGMAGRFPGARDVSAFWQNLVAGVESIAQLTDAELRADGVAEELLKDPDYVKARPLLDDVEMFDPEFFGISPREAVTTDPQHRLFLECAWEALENGGYDPKQYGGAIGVYGGLNLNSYLLANLHADPDFQELLTSKTPGAYQAYLGNDKDFLATRVAYKLDLRGPAITVQTACSTSLVAICQACQSLLYYQCDMALAGGISILFPLRHGYFAQEGGMNSPDGHCRAFDAKANGTVFGNGVGVVLLKRLADAVADGDTIVATIKGSALNNDGSNKVSFTAPSVNGQVEVVALAHALAGVTADSISYVEAHGTGTPLGDPIEVAALTQAFQQTTDRVSFCGIGSCKPNIGHLDVAAGVTGVIKTALALQHRLLPRTVHFTAPNPKIDFANSPFHVIDRLTEWRSDGQPRRAGVSSFGVGGTNAHVVMEEAPERPPSRATRPVHLLTLSARTPAALEQMTANLADYLERTPAANLADVAYTLNVGRRAFPHRRIVTVRNRAEAVARLRQPDPKRVFTAPAVRGAASAVFMFPGQGAQAAGMGMELYRAEPAYRAAFDECAEILRPELGLDLSAVLADAEQLTQTRLTQPAVFATEYALAQLWLSWGVRPVALIGHSIGEYVAACVAGVFTLPDALRVVARRAALMQELPAGVMLAVRLPEVELLPWLHAPLSLAAVNSPGLCVVAGPEEAVATLERQLKERGTASVRLQTSHAFHSAMMEPVLAPLIELIASVSRQSPTIPYISNVTGHWITGAEATDPAYWAKHTRQTVRFADGVAHLLQEPQTVLLEVGPGQTLSTLTRQHPQRAVTHSVLASLPDKQAEQESALTTLGRLWAAGVPVDWPALHAGEPRYRVPLPTYPFERKPYFVGQGLDHTAAPVAIATTTVPVDDKGKVILELKQILSRLQGRDCGELDTHTTFVELGFESLFLTQVRMTVEKRFGIRIGFRQLLGDVATLDALAGYLMHGKKTAPVAAAPEPTAGALTQGQREIWLATAMSEAASCAFNLSNVLRLRGPLDVLALERAFQALMRRHEALRTTFAANGETQQVAPAVTLPVAVVDWTALPPVEQAAQWEALLKREAGTPFDLGRGPLLRVTVARFGPTDQAVVMTLHHLVSDGQSVALLFHELGELYSGKSDALPAARPYSEFVRQELQQVHSPAYAAAEEYWLGQFATEPPPVELPADHPRPRQVSFRGAVQTVELPVEVTRELRRLSGRHGCTLATTMLAADYLFLRRLTGQTDLVVGIPVASPNAGGTAPLVGHSVNFLPVRAVAPDEPTWPAHLAAVKQVFIDGYDHRQFTYNSLLQKLKFARDPNRMPLVAVGFNYAQTRHSVRFAGLAAELEGNPFSYTNLDLNMDFTEDGDRVTLDCAFNSDLFEPATIRRWTKHFLTLLANIVAHPDQPVTRLAWLSPTDRQQLLEDWNATRQELPRETGVHNLFEAQARRTPDAVAAVCDRQSVTYRELDERADRLARHLRTLGVVPGALVGIYVERSLDMLVGLLGILKAGGAYLPLDPQFPAERLAFMLEDAQPVVLLTQQKLRNVLPRHQSQVVCIDDLPATAPEFQRAGSPLAYVLYTSGSTGKPKGVQIPHSAVVNFLLSMQREPGLTPNDVVVAVTTLSFDIAGLELWLPLMTGARVVIANREAASDGAQLAQLLAESQATVLQATPATWRVLLAIGWKGRPGLKMLCGGEALPVELAKALLPCGASLWNMYGPTETTVWSAVSRVEAGQPIRIGHPIANTALYVVDRQLQPVPIGVPGELLIGGAGLALGYLNRPELTAEKFVTAPFPGGGRVYRTGDLVRRHADGSLEFLGRLDHQVKIRGYRIELGEIETALGRHPAVGEAVVLAREDVPGDQRLVAYLTAKNSHSPDAAELRKLLAATLPDYMVPAAFMVLESFPLTPNGKVNRKALPAPDQTAAAAREMIAPRTPLEQQLATIWLEVLRVPRLGVQDNFFELGGHSLLAAQVASRVRDTLGVTLPLRTVFEHPTIEALAPQIETLRAGAPAVVTMVEGEL